MPLTHPRSPVAGFAQILHGSHGFPQLQHDTMRGTGGITSRCPPPLHAHIQIPSPDGPLHSINRSSPSTHASRPIQTYFRFRRRSPPPQPYTSYFSPSLLHLSHHFPTHFCIHRPAPSFACMIVTPPALTRGGLKQAPPSVGRATRTAVALHWSERVAFGYIFTSSLPFSPSCNRIASASSPSASFGARPSSTQSSAAWFICGE